MALTADEQALVKDSRGPFEDWSYRDLVELIRGLGKALEDRGAGEPSLDPKPWIYGLFGPQDDTYFESGRGREAEQVTGGFVFAPRKRYSQDRGDYA